MSDGTGMGILVAGEQEIDALLGKIDIRGALERMFRGLAEGQATQPPQTLALFPADRGDFITYLGVLAEEKVFGAKLSPYIPLEGRALVTAWTVLMSMETGAPVLLCDSRRLTTERTAATTAIAVDLLARDDAEVLTLIGSGPVALAHLRYAEGLRRWTEVRIASPNAKTKGDLPKATAGGAPVTVSADADAAAQGADVVMLCTSSGKPVIDASRLAAGTLVTSISTNAANAHEIDPALLGGFDVYCDYRATTPSSAGEMRLAAKAGGWSPAAIRGDLPGLLAGTSPKPGGDRLVFFRSIGLGLEDIAAAAAVLKALSA